MADDEDAYSVLEIAEHTGLHPETIRRWVKNDKVKLEPTKTKKNGFRIKKREILRYIHESKRDIHWK